MQEEGEMVKHGKGLRYNLSQPYSTLAKVHIPTSLDPEAYNVRNNQLHI